MMFPSVKLLCFFYILSTCNAHRRNKGYYRAAVHEHKQYNDETSSGRDIIDKNLKMYEVAAALAKSNDVDIIVFPEKGLFPMKTQLPTWFLDYAEDVPNGRKRDNPCLDGKYSGRPILTNLSCIAKKHNFYVVATLIDVKRCKLHSDCEKKENRNSCVSRGSDCPQKGFFYFNTLVVFNRMGDLIARYYKRHPFYISDPDIETPQYPQPGYFRTEFGTFALDIGFDILFNDSVIEIEKRPWTNAVSYANWWFDHTPLFFFGVPVQQAFSIANRVTVLSSDVHFPNSGSLGSGIYLADRGAVVYSYNPDGKSKLLISNIPTSFSGAPIDKGSLHTKFLYIEDDGTASELNGEEPRDFKEECGDNVLGTNTSSFNDYRCHQSNVDQYTFVKLNKTEDNIIICSNKFCCNLEYQAESMDETFYFAVSGNVLKFYDLYLFGVQSCFLARCEPVDGKPCRNFLLKSNTRFQNVKITGSFDTSHVYPHILDSDLRLTDKDEWKFDGNSLLYQNLRGENLLFANLFGRIYEKDGLTTKGKAAKAMKGKI